MADCECLAGCPFFNDRMQMDQGLGLMYKNHYCKGDNSKCARHMVLKAKGKGNVPPSLFPNQFDIATAIISGRAAPGFTSTH
jgi:hypothetical protein